MSLVHASRVPAWERGTNTERSGLQVDRRTDATFTPVVDGKGCGRAKAMDRRCNERHPPINVDHGYDANGIRRIGVHARGILVLINAIGDDMLLLPEHPDEIGKGHPLVVDHQGTILESEESDFSAASTESRLYHQLTM